MARTRGSGRGALLPWWSDAAAGHEGAKLPDDVGLRSGASADAGVVALQVAVLRLVVFSGHDVGVGLALRAMVTTK